MNLLTMIPLSGLNCNTHLIQFRFFLYKITEQRFKKNY